MKRRRMIQSWRKISVLLFVLGCLFEANKEVEWNGMKWIDQREMSFKAKHNPKRNQAQIDSMLFRSISSLHHSISPHSFFLLHLHVKQTIQKTIIHTLFNRFPKHKMNTMHQLREITILSFLNHFYPSFLHFILTFPRLLH